MIKDFKYWKSLHESERLEEFEFKFNWTALAKNKVYNS
jgi:hypothetical protein